jgi:hypothetical protein
MSTSQPKTSTTHKRWVFSSKLGCLSILLMSPFLLYYAYCWGVWGRNSLLLQHLFQCKCPAASEEARYPKEVDVIISACNNAVVMPFPNGRRLYVREEKFGLVSIYLLNLETKEKTPLGFKEGYLHFLSDDIVYIWLYYGEGEYILDGATGMQYPIQSFKQLYPGAFSDGDLNPDLLLQALLQSDKVFLIDAAADPAIALSSDFRAHPEHNFIFNRFELPEYWESSTEQFLRQNNVAFQYAAARFPLYSLPEEVVSPNGKFVARNDGIHLAETNRLIVKAPISLVRGWTYDGRGVIYAVGKRCLLRLAIPMMDDSWCEIEVSQPVFLVKVPEEYLSSTQTP